MDLPVDLAGKRSYSSAELREEYSKLLYNIDYLRADVQDHALTDQEREESEAELEISLQRRAVVYEILHAWNGESEWIDVTSKSA